MPEPTAFKDHFSALAADYAAYRPTYPPEFFAWLAAQCPGHERVWDCATGNGQAAGGLAPHFAEVIATDASATQIAAAQGPDNVHFAVAPAEAAPLADHSTDLVMVAQAAHWFDLPAFYTEVRRVLRPGGVVCLLTYSGHQVDPEIAPIAQCFYRDTVGPYWPPERRLVEEGYRSLPFPFTEIHAPRFELKAQWTLAQFLGYQATWSATKRYREMTGHDPLVELAEELGKVWGGEGRVREVRWPLGVRVGRV